MKRDILFICQANIGRSQMAEGFYNHITRTTDAISAGVDDFRQKYNFRPTTDIIETMKEKGIDISSKKIDIVTEQLVENSHMVIVLCAKEMCPQYLRNNPKTIFYEVRDPFSQHMGDIRIIRDQIEVIVNEVILTKRSV